MTAARKTIGYELLYRAGWENRFSGDCDAASNSIVDWAITQGFDSLIGDTPAFVNCTRSLLLNRSAALLPQGTILEILETVDADDEVLEACRYYRNNGFSLALDDFDFRVELEPFFDLVQYIKIDFSQTLAEDRRDLIARLKPRGIRFIAERIEDSEQLQTAVAEGFDFFQGYFFMRPVVTARSNPGNSLQHLKLLAEICKPRLDFDVFLRLIRAEPALCYRLLRYVNSAAIASRCIVSDLRHAVMLIGEDQCRRIIRTALAAELTQGSCSDAMERCMQRARFCELLAEEVHGSSEEFYLMGMFSAVLPLLNLEIAEIARHLPLSSNVIAALITPNNNNDHAQVLALTMAYEHGNWARMAESCNHLGMHGRRVAAMHHEAAQWAALMVQNI